MSEIYTIGYSGFKLEDFICVLKSYNINGLIDVRSTPVSKYYTDYNKQELSASLKKWILHTVTINMNLVQGKLNVNIIRTDTLISNYLLSRNAFRKE